MAPILNSTTGMLPQIMESPELIDLLRHLNALEPLSDFDAAAPTTTPDSLSSRQSDMDGSVPRRDHAPRGEHPVLLGLVRQLTELLLPYKDVWPFEELVDLYDWIRPLNVMDSVLTQVLNTFSTNILLLPSYTHPQVQPAATSIDHIHACPVEIITGIVTVLQFTTLLLSNATSKHLYSSIPAVSDLLAAADESIVFAAIKALSALSLPSVSHKLQNGPDRHHHNSLITQLHQSSSSVRNGSHSNSIAGGKKYRSDVHDRLMCIAKAYGTRTTGHGLYTIVTTDDSVYGQGNNTVLPKSLGEIYFTYQKNTIASTSEDKMMDDGDDEYDGTATIAISEADLKVCATTLSDINVGDVNASPSPDHSTASFTSSDGIKFASTSSNSKKRRKVTTTGTIASESIAAPTLLPQYQGQNGHVKSTAEIFFMIMERLPGGLDDIPSDRWYALLHDIRMARHFYTQNDRCTITMQRLYSLITVLHAHPSSGCLNGYFSAQPDIGSDIADLLRPMVNSANISIAPATSVTNTTVASSSSIIHSTDLDVTNNDSNHISPPSALRPDAIANLVDDTNNQSVPFGLRILAVDAISALITRRDGSTSMSTFSGGRLQSLLIDLGVGKGQYLGLLPTLIRYSLSALSSIADLHRYDSRDDTSSGKNVEPIPPKPSTPDAFDIGLAFVEATLAPPPSRKVQIQRALLFLDSVLTLTSNVIGTSSGLTALVDCGLIPALVTAISIDPNRLISNLVNNAENITTSEIRRMKSSLRFITAQAVQLLEPVTATSSNALASFQDLKGVDALVKRLDYEIKDIKEIANIVLVSGDFDGMDVDGDDAQSAKGQQKVLSSHRSLIFCILTCLTVVLHQESNSESSSIGSAQLRTDELTGALSEILQHVSVYGGYLVSLVTTFLSDAMNNDPHIVSHVLKSGLAVSFLSLFDKDSMLHPKIPPVPEIIMSIPSTISAIALTDDGAKLILEHDPFPAFLRIFYHADYVMPKSQCLLHEMASIIGTGLDEIIRHVERLKPLVVSAIADAMEKVVTFALDLVRREEGILTIGYTLTDEILTLEHERSCLIQYILNFSQLLEQFLHNEENCEKFVDAGCFDSVLRLSQISMLPVQQFLPHISSLSAPAVSTLHHSTTEEALNVSCKCLELRYNAVKVLRKLIDVAHRLLDDLDKSQKDVLGSCEASFILDKLPQEPVYKLNKAADQPFLMAISRYLQNVANVQWITSLIANAFKSAYQRSSESSWNQTEDSWKKELSTNNFAAFIGRLSAFHTTALYEVCRARAEDTYIESERKRYQTRSPTVRYRLRIVCLEGAVVRDGIEIDSCLNVGSLEMGDIVEASDRCINSSGILRYHSKRGWISEMTRGHGREPISEVINMYEVENEMLCDDVTATKRIEAGIPCVRNVAVAVLARCQASCSELFSALSKLVFQGIRTLSLPVDLANSDAGNYLSSITKILADSIKQTILHAPISMKINSSSTDLEPISDAGVALYLGSTLSLVSQCLFDEKRERRSINLPLLVSLLSLGPIDSKTTVLFDKGQITDETGRGNATTPDLLKAIEFVFKHGLDDFSQGTIKESGNGSRNPEHQRVNESVASSFPPAILLLRKFSSTPLSSSPVASIMSRLRWKEVSTLLCLRKIEFPHVGVPGDEEFFHPESIMADLVLCMSKIVFKTFTDEKIRFVPPHILHPLVNLVGDTMTALKDVSKKKLVKSIASSSDSLRLAEVLRLRQADGNSNVTEAEQFEASEESITRLMEMGFSRQMAQQALQRTQSNELESAMDHLLSITPDRILGQSTGGEPALESQIDIQHDTDIEVPQQASGQHQEIDENKMELVPEISLIEMATSSEVTTCDVLAGKELETWISAVPMIFCKVLSNVPPHTLRRAVQASGRKDYGSLFKLSDGDGEAETFVVILCTFLMELLQSYPEKLRGIFSFVLSHLNKKVSVDKERNPLMYKIESKDEATFSSLCHAVVLLTKAHPKCRRLILEINFVGKIVSCIESTFTLIENDDNATIPLWFTPAVLLLDIIAQPFVAFSKKEIVSSTADDGEDSELKQVQKQHSKQLQEISAIVEQWMKTTSTKSVSEKSKSKSEVALQNDVAPITAASIEASTSKTCFSEKIPAYFSLLPDSSSLRCVDLCKYILVKMRSRNLSPGLVQSTVFLLLRLLRSTKVSSDCLQTGMAEIILGLPKRYSFTGSSGVVTLILRRLIEDDTTLLNSMETDIRSTFAKLQVSSGQKFKENNVSTQITLNSFMEATTHLLCRDPLMFFKAMTLSVVIVPPARKVGEPPTVVLLSMAERTKILEMRTVSKILNTKQAHSEQVNEDTVMQSFSAAPSPKAKLGRRSTRRISSTKKSKRVKDDTPRAKKHDLSKPIAGEIPASRITNLLIQSIVASTSSLFVDNDENQFLTAHELIDILSELVIAIPTCASAVHNHRYYRSKDKRMAAFTGHTEHALKGCPSPPRTFITFLLHHVLPQDMWAIRNDLELWNRAKGSITETMKTKKKIAFDAVKVAQSTGKLLLSLAVRPGDGRRRIVSDLVFALSGGRLGHGSTDLPTEIQRSAESPQPRNSDLKALLVWSELCLALVAPKNNGKNLDTFSTLNLDNIRIMLECGTVHSLLFALHRIKTVHPMASNLHGAILLPLEILSRANVYDAIIQQTNKELQPDSTMTTTTEPMDTGNTLDPEANQPERLNLEVNVSQDIDGNLGVSYRVLEDTRSMEDVDSQDETLEGGLEREEEEERSSADEDSDADEDESDIDSDEDEIDDEEMSEGSDSEGESNNSNDVEEAAWDVENHDTFVHDGEEFEEEDDDDEEEATEGVEDTGAEEGWTRIESNGGFLINNSLRSRAGFVGAAEAMINSLFRHEDISSEALAEIEGTLGIRITRGGNGANVDLAARIASINSNEIRDAPGSIRRVQQRSQPVVGYSGFGRSSIEVNAMEYVFGGPTVTGCSQNYDVTSSSQDAFSLDNDHELTLLDLHVFPNGPASVLNARTYSSLHPMLCGVDLPPISCLVSDILPSGVRASRQPATRRFGELAHGTSSSGHVFTVSNRELNRSTRPHINGSFEGSFGDRNTFTVRGWTDDGLRVDTMAQEFTSALVGTLEEITVVDMSHNDENANSTLNDEIDTSNNSELPSGNGERVQSSEIANSTELTSDSVLLETDTTMTTNETQTNTGPEVEDGSPSDGEGVVSSVAELRLSTESEETESQHPIASCSGNVPRQDDESNVMEVVHENQTTANEPPGNDITNEAQSLACASGDDALQAGDTLEDTAESTGGAPTPTGLVCPPDVDVSVFHSLPLEMQQDCVNQYSATQELAAQLTGSTLDPEVLAALPEEIRREIIEQDRQERSLRAQEDGRADPSHAEEMDNASFLASLSPDLREEILLTADQDFLNSLPPGVVAEAQILRERASVTHRRHYETTLQGAHNGVNSNVATGSALTSQDAAVEDTNGLARRRQRVGKLKVDLDRKHVVFVPEKLSSPFAVADLKALFLALYLLTPVQPQKLLPKFFFNLCANASLRYVITSTIIHLLGEDYHESLSAIESLRETYEETDTWKATIDLLFSSQIKFPPLNLIGTSREVQNSNGYDLWPVNGSISSFAGNLPKSISGNDFTTSGIPPMIATRLMDLMLHLSKNPLVCVQVLTNNGRITSNDGVDCTLFDKLLELLQKPMFFNSSNNLETLLTLFEAVLTPLSYVSRPHGEDDIEIPQRDIEAAAAAGKEYIDVPQVAVSQRRLQLLCSILRMEACRDTAFTKVNTIIRRLCRVETNRGHVLTELVSVAHALSCDALLDLRSLRIRMDDAAAKHHHQILHRTDIDVSRDSSKSKDQVEGLSRSISSSVTLSSSNSESKLLRVLQTLHALCNDTGDDAGTKKSESTVVVTDELAQLLRQMKFDDLWDELSKCLKVVQVLEGVRTFEETEHKVSEDLDINEDGSAEDGPSTKKKLRNSAAGLLARFLPSMEAFFIANAYATRTSSDTTKKSTITDSEITIESMVGGHRMLEFLSTHRVLVNALIRNNFSLLEKGFRALVLVPRCRVLLDFDVKRQWFKSQVRRLRQQASRRHGSLRLQIRRKSVFEDAYHQLQPRNADEMRGRLHVTFRNEEGVDAGGLSREFFAILAKEMFNPNYALFTSTEDGCTFQPNPNSMINPDHLSYFRFVGRVVGKAVADGYLLDAHFTRSLYKHMLGMQPTHHDMEAIDPDYYRNLKTILEYNLADIGLDLTFSIEDHSFGRSQVIDLLPNGRSIPVTEENKEEYVRLVCQHRMTTSIQSQIKSYLAGFYELVSLDLIAIFSPKELELLISGLPDIDVHDLKEHTDYVGWKSTDKEIVWFWNIVFGLSRNEKASFLQFVTGSSKVPLSGFAELQGMRGVQKFSIHKMSGKKGALMSAHTCFNSLDLPSYDNEDEMRQKFLLAINEGAGAFYVA